MPDPNEGSTRRAGAHALHLDRAALGGSLLCLLHCLALPVLLAFVPALASTLLIGTHVHFMMLLFAIPTTAMALIAGWRQYRRLWPLLTGLAGLSGLAAGAAMAEGGLLDSSFTVCGGLMLILAHVGNLRLRSRKIYA